MEGWIVRAAYDLRKGESIAFPWRLELGKEIVRYLAEQMCIVHGQSTEVLAVKDSDILVLELAADLVALFVEEEELRLTLLRRWSPDKIQAFKNYVEMEARREVKMHWNFLEHGVFISLIAK